jgi:hypothetical protein
MAAPPPAPVAAGTGSAAGRRNLLSAEQTEVLIGCVSHLVLRPIESARVIKMTGSDLKLDPATTAGKGIEGAWRTSARKDSSMLMRTLHSVDWFAVLGFLFENGALWDWRILQVSLMRLIVQEVIALHLSRRLLRRLPPPAQQVLLLYLRYLPTLPIDCILETVQVNLVMDSVPRSIGGTTDSTKARLYTSPWHCFVTLLRQYGMRYLLGSMFTKLFVFIGTRTFYLTAMLTRPRQYQTLYISLVGTFSSWLFLPVVTVQHRMAANPSYESAVHCFLSVLKTQGWRALCRGSLETALIGYSRMLIRRVVVKLLGFL